MYRKESKRAVVFVPKVQHQVSVESSIKLCSVYRLMKDIVTTPNKNNASLFFAKKIFLFTIYMYWYDGYFALN